MSSTKMWYLDDADLPEELHTVRDIFMPRRERAPQPTVLPKDMKKTDRKHGEGLHDYLTRKGIKCFCRACVKANKLAAQQNNEKLL